MSQENITPISSFGGLPEFDTEPTEKPQFTDESKVNSGKLRQGTVLMGAFFLLSTVIALGLYYYFGIFDRDPVANPPIEMREQKISIDQLAPPPVTKDKGSSDPQINTADPAAYPINKSDDFKIDPSISVDSSNTQTTFSSGIEIAPNLSQSFYLETGGIGAVEPVSSQPSSGIDAETRSMVQSHDNLLQRHSAQLTLLSAQIQELKAVINAIKQPVFISTADTTPKETIGIKRPANTVTPKLLSMKVMGLAPIIRADMSGKAHSLMIGETVQNWTLKSVDYPQGTAVLSHPALADLVIRI